MNLTLSIICVFLLILFIVLFIYIICIKRQIKKFSEEIEKLRSTDYNKLITVDGFNKEIVELANQLNRQIKEHRKIEILYQNKEQHLHDIITGISHDFRTPLTAINGYLQMIDKSKKLSGTEQEYLNIAVNKTEYLKNLSDDFFELTYIESKNQEIPLTPVNICNILTECILCRYDIITSLNLKTDFNIPKTPVFIESNPHILNRIFENLFSNAEKYAESYIKVVMFYDINELTIKFFNDVSDLSAIAASKVFEPFYRGNSRTKDGSGIGLYVVKYLSERLGFNINSELDKNGIFTITLKYNEAHLTNSQYFV